ncbi:DNA polymerase epsilon catalytic subunit A-like [Pyrus ussuriensis x Pyrus communis]|uniref:DNA polymerase epsilon catalytic subunit A-like n=1 Tax=Pyrus ussuriensis x Pyrus communis TaxID=2448454 RepID=A0A5N5GHY5_9ROSA|nr:DNA polymerase epsilon catalytic subunit A-like [Pyrus ussuriensis x Pyrus communis]
MASSVSYEVFIASLVLCLSSSPAPFANARASQLVRSVCKQTQDQFGYNYKPCVKSLWKDIPIRLATNLKDLDIAVLKLAAANAALTKATFEKAFNATSKNANGMSAIKQCVDSYDFALGAFVFVVRGVNDGDKSVMEILTQAQDELVRCQRALASVEVQLPMPISATKFCIMLNRDVAFLVTSQLLNV